LSRRDPKGKKGGENRDSCRESLYRTQGVLSDTSGKGGEELKKGKKRGCSRCLSAKRGAGEKKLTHRWRQELLPFRGGEKEPESICGGAARKKPFRPNEKGEKSPPSRKGIVGTRAFRVFGGKRGKPSHQKKWGKILDCGEKRACPTSWKGKRSR